MAFAIPPPDPVKVGSHLEESWASYKEDLEIYMQATGQDALEPQQKAGLLLVYIGREAKQLISNWNFSDATRRNYDRLIAAIDAKIKPKSFPVVNRLLFRRRTRRTNEDIEDYYTELKKLSVNCEFGEEEKEHMIIDNLIDSIQEHDLQQICMKDLSIKRAENVIEKIKDYEKLREVSNQLTEKNGNTIYHIKYEKSRPPMAYHQYQRCNQSRSRSRSYSRPPSNRFHSKSRSKSPSYSTRQASPAPDEFKKKPCRRCQSRHPFGECPAEGYKCEKCHKINHFTRCCTSVKINSISSRSSIKKSHHHDPSPSSEEDFNLIHNLSSSKHKSKGWFEVIEVCNIPINFKLDPGSEINTIPSSFIKKNKINSSIIRPVVQALAYTNLVIETEGIVSLPVNCRGIKTHLDFVIIKHYDVPVLGVETCERLNLAQRVPPHPTVYSITNTRSDNTPDHVSKFIKENQDITALTPVADPEKDKIRKATSEDPELQEIKRYILLGWPESRNHLPEMLKHYWQYREEIHQENGLVFFGFRIIIPRSLRKEMLKNIHEGHLGISNMHSLAVKSIYWPRIYQEITGSTRERVPNRKYLNG